MKKIVLLLAALAVTAFSGGKEKTCPHNSDSLPYNITKVSYISVGGSYFDLDALNSNLQKSGYPSLDNAVAQVAIGSDYRYNRLISDYTFTGHWWRRGENTDKRTRLFGLDFTSTIGFDLLEQPKVALYPYAGLGIGGLFLQLGHRDIPFDDVTNGSSPADQLLAQMTLDIHTGLGFDIRAKESGDSPLFGIKAGYRFDVSDAARWYRDYSTVSGAPSLKASGPFVKLVFGFARDK